MLNGYKTEFSVRVVVLGPVTKHPNADKLQITYVDGQACVVQSGLWSEGDKAVYVPIDAIVPLTRREFAFLSNPDKPERTARVKAKRLRGIFSQGILIPLEDPTTPVGTDMAGVLGVVKYDPEAALEKVSLKGGAAPSTAPPGAGPTYGIANLRKCPGVLQNACFVTVTEKIHGANARYYYDGRNFRVGTHRTWQAPPRGTTRGFIVLRAITSVVSSARDKVDEYLAMAPWLLGFLAPISSMLTKARDKFQAAMQRRAPRAPSLWWIAAQKYGIEERMRKDLGAAKAITWYGEIYGPNVQKGFAYGIAPGDVGLRLFNDVHVHTEREDYDCHMTVDSDLAVPVLLERDGPVDIAEIQALAEGKSVLDGITMREGVVVDVRAQDPKQDAKYKWVSEAYLMSD